MFGNKKKKKTNAPQKVSAPAPNSGGLNSLVQQTNLEGTINADSDFRVDGRIKGTLNCASKVIIGPTGYVEGVVKCQNAVIEGKFVGDLKVADSLTVKEHAMISGDVRTSSLTVHQGAIFDVVCKMSKGSKQSVELETEDILS